MSRSLVAFALVGLAAVAASATQPDSSTWHARLGRIVEPFLAEHRVPGMSVAVVRDGELVAAEGFGHTAPGGGAPVTGDTKFRLASVAKTLTAVVVHQLVAEGRLALDDSATRRCPAFTPTGGDPTIGHLLLHQSGLRHTTDEEDTTIAGDYPRLAPAVARIGRERLRFAPGTDVNYTSWGYTVLGCAVEEVTGERFFDVLKTRVLDEAGMTATVADRPDLGGTDFSRGFRVRGGRVAPSEVVDTRFKQPASGLVSSAADLGRFAVALFDGTLLPAESLAQMVSPQQTRVGTATPFAMGVLAAQDRSHGAAVYHGGAMEGTTAFLYLIPERGLAIALLANRERFAAEVATLVPPIRAIALEPNR